MLLGTILSAVFLPPFPPEQTGEYIPYAFSDNHMSVRFFLINAKTIVDGDGDGESKEKKRKEMISRREKLIRKKKRKKKKALV